MLSRAKVSAVANQSAHHGAHSRSPKGGGPAAKREAMKGDKDDEGDGRHLQSHVCMLLDLPPRLPSDASRCPPGAWLAGEEGGITGELKSRKSNSLLTNFTKSLQWIPTHRGRVGVSAPPAATIQEAGVCGISLDPVIGEPSCWTHPIASDANVDAIEVQPARVCRADRLARHPPLRHDTA
jgi:hypothetical protein